MSINENVVNNLSVSTYELTNLLNSISNQGHASNSLLSYFAFSFAKNFKYDLCYDLMEKRTPAWPDTKPFPTLNFSSYEKQVFKVRFDLLNKDNRAYSLSTKIFPTVSDLEELAEIKTCWSILFPIKCYLIEHFKEAKEYRGLQPFGKYVVSFYNSLFEDEKDHIGINSPDFKAHIKLRDLTNWLSDLTGKSTAIINTEMYLEGQKIYNHYNQ